MLENRTVLDVSIAPGKDDDGGRARTPIYSIEQLCPVLVQTMGAFGVPMLVVRKNGVVLAQNAGAREHVGVFERDERSNRCLPFANTETLHRWQSFVEHLVLNEPTMMKLDLFTRACHVSVVAMLVRQFDEPVLVIAFERSPQLSEAALSYLGESYHLTRAEREIVRLLSAGLDPKEIATKRNVSMATVRTQIRCALEKMDLQSVRALLVLLARLPL